MTKEEELLNYLKVASYNCLSEKSPITKVELSRRILKEGNCDCSEELKTNVRIYKKKAIQSIINIESKIDNLKEKIESANSELGNTYQIRFNELEHKKIALICRLEGYIVNNENWNSFKNKFNSELDSFEDELTDFAGNFSGSK